MSLEYTSRTFYIINSIILFNKVNNQIANLAFLILFFNFDLVFNEMFKELGESTNNRIRGKQDIFSVSAGLKQPLAKNSRR